MMIPEFCKGLRNNLPEYKFSICTLVSNPQEYKEMVDSFIGSGFTTNDCEYLFADNTNGNSYDGYSGLNKFLQDAKGEYIIICHQDVLINYDNRTVLEKRIEEISAIDNTWALLGNAGAVGLKNIVYKLYNNAGQLEESGKIPSKVISLDENFIVAKKSANLAVSSDLKGFHLYATDICIIAEILGFSAYVIDFALIHKSKGNVDQSFIDIQTSLKQKYKNHFRGRYIRTTITEFYLSSNPILTYFFESSIIKKLMYQYYKLKFRGKLFDRKVIKNK